MFVHEVLGIIVSHYLIYCGLVLNVLVGVLGVIELGKMMFKKK